MFLGFFNGFSLITVQHICCDGCRKKMVMPWKRASTICTSAYSISFLPLITPPSSHTRPAPTNAYVPQSFFSVLSAIPQQPIEHEPPQRQHRQRIEDKIGIGPRQPSPRRSAQRINRIQRPPKRIAAQCQQHHQTTSAHPSPQRHHHGPTGFAFQCIPSQERSREVTA